MWGGVEVPPDWRIGVARQRKQAAGKEINVEHQKGTHLRVCCRHVGEKQQWWLAQQ